VWVIINQVTIFVPSSFLPPDNDTRQLRFLVLSMRYKPGPFQSDMVRRLGGAEKGVDDEVGLGIIGDDVRSETSKGAARRGFL
jgi:hypothetical protein